MELYVIIEPYFFKYEFFIAQDVQQKLREDQFSQNPSSFMRLKIYVKTFSIYF